MWELKDLKGQRFGRLVALDFAGYDNNKKGMWRCKCDCGNEVVVRTNGLTSGNTKSCGCLRKINNGKRTHGMTRTRLGSIYIGMKQRCFNPKTEHYSCYGGRGITICDEWLGKDGACAFFEWAKSNGYKEGLTIDRINVNGNYEPSNCRWVDMHVQALNRRQAKSQLGIKGVYLRPSGRYESKIKIYGKIIHLGTFNTIEEAAAARKAAELKYYGQVLD